MKNVIGRLINSSPKSHIPSFIWECKCGKVLITTQSRFKKMKSCGCKINNSKRSHGMSGARRNNPEYCTWKDIRRRCSQKATYKDKKHYLDKGVKVCDRWLSSFENFYTDMGPRPSGFSIDRINPNGNYEPSNCRWVDNRTQSRNRSHLKRHLYNGELLLISEISEITGIKRTTIQERIRRGWSEDQAFGLEVR